MFTAEQRQFAESGEMNEKTLIRLVEAGISTDEKDIMHRHDLTVYKILNGQFSGQLTQIAVQLMRSWNAQAGFYLFHIHNFE